MEDDLKGRRPQWKTTLIEDDLNGGRPEWKRPQWKTTSMEDDLNGSLTLACLASKFCIELGPAQPQLVFHIFS